MRMRYLGEWLQILASVAVVVGIIAVIVELRQQRELADMSLTSGQIALIHEGLMRGAGEEHGPLLRKACVEPENFTELDLVRLSHLLDAALLRASRVAVLNASPEHAEEVTWELAVKSELEWILSHPHGADWLRREHEQNRLIPRVSRIYERVESDKSSRSCRGYYLLDATSQSGEALKDAPRTGTN